MMEMFFLKRGRRMGWTKLHSEGLHDWYWWVNVGGWWTERQWDRLVLVSECWWVVNWKTEGQIGTGEWMLVGGELKDSGTDWYWWVNVGGWWPERQWDRLVLVSECWWVVNWKTVGQMGREKRTGEFKNTHQISVCESVRGRLNFGILGL